MLAMSTIPVVVLVVAVVYAIGAQRAAARTNAEVDRSNTTQQAIEAFQVDLAVAESSVRGYILTTQPEILTGYEETLRAVRRDLAQLDSTVDEGVQRERLDRLEHLVTVRLEVFRIVLGTAGRDRTPATQAVLETQLLRGQRITEELQRLTGTMRAAAADIAATRVAARDAAFQRSFLVQVLAMPVAVFVAMVMMAIFTARIVRRVARMQANAKRLDDGLPMDAPDTSADELGSLSRALVRTGSNLEQLQQELRQLATFDELTGLSNRRGFFALAEHELLVAARTRTAVALLFLDVDGLKAVNDQCGHSCGDLLLKETAEVIRETIRVSDLAARIGGDEFCVLLVGDPELDAERVVQRMQDTAAVHNANADRKYRISFSVGVSSLAPGRSVTLEELLDAADESMYEDKRAKRGAEPVWSI
jgi:diguanylate cyclase (GGDEF)-like protein